MSKVNVKVECLRHSSADFSGTERQQEKEEKEKEHGETTKGLTP